MIILNLKVLFLFFLRLGLLFRKFLSKKNASCGHECKLESCSFRFLSCELQANSGGLLPKSRYNLLCFWIKAWNRNSCFANDRFFPMHTLGAGRVWVGVEALSFSHVVWDAGWTWDRRYYSLAFMVFSYKFRTSNAAMHQKSNFYAMNSFMSLQRGVGPRSDFSIK